jgi:hypothetical protein
MVRFIDRTLVALIWVLGIFSIIALLSVHWTLFTKYYFSFSPSGLNFYLSQIGRYKELFGATVLIMGTYFALHRLNAATDANILKVKADRFVEWKSVLDTIILPDLAKENSYMKRLFIRHRYSLFEKLYDLNFKIDNVGTLRQVFEEHFQNRVQGFEEQNREYIGMGGIYRDNQFSYSFDDFQFLFTGCIYSAYAGLYDDLKNLYLAQFPQNRQIDAELYSRAYSRYYGVI